MNFLVIDGNSIVNRAFYGIKQLNAKDGHYTNAIYGFMNIFLSLVEKLSPEAVAVAFDVDRHTFRHQEYPEYKAGRKGMPPELFEQMEPLKRLLDAYGCHIVECKGYEADDILGTLSAACPADSHCYLATGDRDSLQLIKDNVSVLLTSTKMGKTQTTEYTPQKLFEEYGVSPAGMIQIKALQGDSSDNIPGVAGIGPKTAGELIKKYNSIDYIYVHLDEIEATQNIKNKLEVNRDNAYLSLKLGTICLNAPVESNISEYILKAQNREQLKKELASHEMFKIISRLGLDSGAVSPSSEPGAAQDKYKLILADGKMQEISGRIFICAEFSGAELAALCVQNGDKLIFAQNTQPFFVDFCKTLFESAAEKYVNDSKPLYSWCMTHDTELLNVRFDAALAGYLLNPNSSDYSLKTLCMSYNVPEQGLASSDAALNDFLEAHSAAFAGVYNFGVLANRMSAVLAENEQTSLLCDIEIPLAEVLASMEIAGIAADRQGIENYSELLNAKAQGLEKEIYEDSGETFNINSPKQLAVVLFEKLGLPAKKKTKSGYSTNAEVLEELSDEYPLVKKILEYRTLTKLKSTYCDGLLKAIADDGRIHSTFNQKETRTGRLSSTEPNLQNIPVRTDIGREFRKFFVAQNGGVIVDADYSQIELRVLAALSDDKNMIDAFNNDTDIHAVTASKVFGVPLSEVSPQLRSKAKAVNFGIVYGIGAFSLSKDIKSTRAEAESFISSYLALYSGVRDYMNACIENARQSGYAKTLYNRRRYLPELQSSNRMLRSFGERVARNMPIQGTAADIIKIAMIHVYRRLKKEIPQASLIMQVHDELMIETPQAFENDVKRLIKEEMENAAALSVKLSVEAAAGKSWYEAKG